MKVPFLAAGLLAAGALADKRVQCKCFPGDDCWPATKDWNKLNSTVNGHLIATVPLASPCHGANYDAARCQTLRDGWQNPGTQYVVKHA